ncbi:MAG: GNAT family N-acetyltransferase [Candidatus Marinimicrobia bacterium]|nr:GNAT family N-acetyltransferase [Candidatus Neomarinimicrobiota bacterium]
MNIRFATPNDIDFIVRANQEMALETEDKPLDQHTVRAGVSAVFQQKSETRYLIAEVDGNPVGNLMITKEWSDWRNGYFWWIQSVFIQSEYRRKGVYKRLHANVKQLAKDNNACGLRLYVDKNNSIAQKTYESLGMINTHYFLFEDDWS